MQGTQQNDILAEIVVHVRCVRERRDDDVLHVAFPYLVEYRDLVLECVRSYLSHRCLTDGVVENEKIQVFQSIELFRLKCAHLCVHPAHFGINGVSHDQSMLLLAFTALDQLSWGQLELCKHTDCCTARIEPERAHTT